MNKLDYDEQFEEIAEDMRAREVRRNKEKPPRESGRSVFELQKNMRKDLDSKQEDKL
ncbi:MAG: hypothetical protein ACOX0G_00130 [Patescibacteria group bacterium]|jgi:hypothetical protein|nr:hypothetical protein [bacterium]HOR57317.1 hypothetical protein [bacterium]HPL56148.1 hypothetical protein [bacterium]